MRNFIFWAASAVLLCGVVASGDDADTYLLQQKAEVGQVRQVNSIMHRDLVQTNTINGVASAPTEEIRDTYFKANVTALDVKDGAPTSVQVDVDPDVHQTVKPPTGGDEKTTKSPLAGITVIVKRSDSNQYTSDYQAGPLSAEQWDDLRPLATPASSLFPDHPIPVGTEWNPTEKFKPHLGLRPGDTATVHCKLESVNVVNDHHIAEVTINIEIVRHVSAAVIADMKTVQTLDFDIDDGRTISIKTKVDGTISTAATEAVQVNGTLTETGEVTSDAVPAAPPAGQ